MSAPLSFAGPLAITLVALGSLIRQRIRRPEGGTTPRGDAEIVDDEQVAVSPPLARARARRPDSPRPLLMSLLVEPVRAIEQRFDLAIGVLIALAVLFVFVG